MFSEMRDFINIAVWFLRMQALVLAAGAGTRLRPLTLDTPKAMIPINGKPMLHVILDQLKSVGVTETVIVVHYLKEKIQEYFGAGEKVGMKLTYVEQKEMRGSADAVRCGAQHITNERFLAIACDSLFPTNHLKALLAVPEQGALTVCKVADARQYGVIAHDGTRVTRIVEKSASPPTNLANTSIYLFPKSIFEACATIPPHPVSKEYLLTDAIQYLIDRGTAFAFREVSDWLDIGTPEQYAEAQSLAKKLGL